MTNIEVAALFRKMAYDVEHNAEAGFGGAFVVVPPEGGGDAFQQLFITTTQDAGDFWILLASKCQAAIRAVDQARTQGFGGRR